MGSGLQFEGRRLLLSVLENRYNIVHLDFGGLADGERSDLLLQVVSRLTFQDDGGNIGPRSNDGELRGMRGAGAAFHVPILGLVEKYADDLSCFEY